MKLAQYHIGEQRMDVIAKLGAPQGSVKDGENSCDVYSLYTSNTNGAQKAAVILGEAGADLFTVGLFEIVATPAQAVTKAKRHTVLVCYGSDSGLVSVKDEGKLVVGEAAPAGGQATPVAAKGPTPTANQ